MKSPYFIQDLYLYPIKSLGGISVQEAQVEERGFTHDRRWMLVDEQGDFVSQRLYPELALFGVSLEGEMMHVYSKKDPLQRMRFGLDEAAGPELQVSIWSDRVRAKVVSENVNRWFSSMVSKELRLVVMPSTTSRKVDPRYAVHSESVSFADGMPYVMIGQASLDELNGRLSDPVSMDRFRPNLVFSGGEAFAEDQFKRLQIGDVEFQVVKPCARCVMITVDQENGEKGKEPLATLATYRSTGNKVYFGQNLVALTRGIVKVGDPIHEL